MVCSLYTYTLYIYTHRLTLCELMIRRSRLQLRVHRVAADHAGGPRVLPQGVGTELHHRRGGQRADDTDSALHVGDRQGVEGQRLRRNQGAEWSAGAGPGVSGWEDQYQGYGHGRGAAQRYQQGILAHETKGKGQHSNCCQFVGIEIRQKGSG